MENRNKIIDESINVIIGLSTPYCHDHTPYCGNCVTCGNITNYNILPELDEVVESLNKLKN